MIGSLVRLKPDYWKIKRSLFLNSYARIQLLKEDFEDRFDKELFHLEDEELLDLADNQSEFEEFKLGTIQNWHKILTALSYWSGESINQPNVPYFSMKITFSEFYNGDAYCFNGFSKTFGSYEINPFWNTNERDRVYGFKPDPEIVKDNPLSRPNLVLDFVEADRFRMLPEIDDPELEQITYTYNFTLADYSEITSKGMISILLQSGPDLGWFQNWCREKNQKIYFPIELFEVVSEA